MIKEKLLKIFFRGSYFGDQFCTFHNSDFIHEKNFKNSYKYSTLITKLKPNIHYRIHQLAWAAQNSLNLKGDFFELGSGRGFSMLAVLNYIKWNRYNKKLYLFDTFSSYKIDEFGNRLNRKSDYYATSFKNIKKNFSKFKNIYFEKGDVFQTLNKYVDKKIAFLHIDLNYAEAEIYSLKLLWNSIVKNGFIILDDYAYRGRERQYKHLNILSKKLNFNILSTLAGQGIIVK